MCLQEYFSAFVASWTAATRAHSVCARNIFVVPQYERAHLWSIYLLPSPAARTGRGRGGEVLLRAHLRRGEGHGCLQGGQPWARPQADFLEDGRPASDSGRAGEREGGGGARRNHDKITGRGVFTVTRPFRVCVQITDVSYHTKRVSRGFDFFGFYSTVFILLTCRHP